MTRGVKPCPEHSEEGQKCPGIQNHVPFVGGTWMGRTRGKREKKDAGRWVFQRLACVERKSRTVWETNDEILKKKKWRERCAVCLTRDCASTRCPRLRRISQVRTVRSYDHIHLYMTSWIAWFWQCFSRVLGFFEKLEFDFSSSDISEGIFSQEKHISYGLFGYKPWVGQPEGDCLSLRGRKRSCCWRKFCPFHKGPLRWTDEKITGTSRKTGNFVRNWRKMRRMAKRTIWWSECVKQLCCFFSSKEWGS